MEDKESGSLSRKAALDLLVELHRGRVTGSLKLERAPLQKAVYFRDGQILFAASNDPKDQLASILVEEGKLGPDQMQVAQARVSPGNPLAKVLTELGYISQRELAEAARIKVEKILTDLYSWKEGTYQFATKSLPKGAIDLELSTARLLFASIRRVQDRDWVLQQLGSLDSVLTPAGDLDSFIAESHAEPLATEVLRLADGVKTVKQIGSLSSLGEFEVCKVLTAGLVAGCLSRDGSTLSSSNDAFAYAGDSFSSPSPSPGFSDTVGLPVSSGSEDQMSYDTIFQAAGSSSSRAGEAEPAEENERTVFEPASFRTASRSDPFLSPPEPDERRSSPATDLVIDEPEPDLGDELHHGRVPPRPKKRGGGGARVSGASGGLVKVLGAVALAGVAGFSIYYFVWPLVGGGAGGGSGAQTTPTTVPVTTAPPSPTTTSSVDPRTGGATTSAPAAAGGPGPATTAPPSVPTPTSVAPSPAQPRPPATTSTPPAATTAPPSGAAKPPTPPGGTSVSPGSGGSSGRALLRSGNLPAAAQSFQQELVRTSADKFTIAVGLYCNAENVSRMIEGAGASTDIYVLPTLVDGKSCYRVVWGLFDSRDAAERSLSSLPNSIRVGDAAPVAISRFLR
jgi:hypothetical protein